MAAKTIDETTLMRIVAGKTKVTTISNSSSSSNLEEVTSWRMVAQTTLDTRQVGLEVASRWASKPRAVGAIPLKDAGIVRVVVTD